MSRPLPAEKPPTVDSLVARSGDFRAYDVVDRLELEEDAMDLDMGSQLFLFRLIKDLIYIRWTIILWSKCALLNFNEVSDNPVPTTTFGLVLNCTDFWSKQRISPHLPYFEQGYHTKPYTGTWPGTVVLPGVHTSTWYHSVPGQARPRYTTPQVRAWLLDFQASRTWQRPFF